MLACNRHLDAVSSAASISSERVMFDNTSTLTLHFKACEEMSLATCKWRYFSA